MRWLAWMLIAVACAQGAWADEDTLGDFEDEIEKREETRKENRRGRVVDEEAEADSDDAVGAAFGMLGAFFGSLEETGRRFEDRRAGAPATAMLTLENSYQSLTGADVEGYTLRPEIVWAFIGVGGEFVRYWEDAPSQTLDFGTIEGVFRFTPTDSIQFTAALGTRAVSGRKTRWGYQGGFSVGIFPTRWLGLKADLRWAGIGGRTLGDYRGGVLLRVPQLPYAAIRGGYRAIQYQGEVLHGAEAGLVLTW